MPLPAWVPDWRTSALASATSCRSRVEMLAVMSASTEPMLRPSSASNGRPRRGVALPGRLRHRVGPLRMRPAVGLLRSGRPSSSDRPTRVGSVPM